MYLQQPDHSKRIIQAGSGKDLYTVWLPPVPSRSFIHGAELKKEDQMWRRQPLPSFYLERRPEELAKQEAEKKLVEDGELKAVTHFDPMLEKYRRQEWMRRIYGFWFMNNGEPVYLTGDHYMYLQWSKLDHSENDGYPFYFSPQLDRFYFRQLCWEDPFCLGYLLVGPRGFGKTSEEVACQLANITRPPHTRHAAIQSKTEDDAINVVFQEKMVPMFNAYPDFFKPQHSHSTDPKESMTFKRVAKRSETDRKNFKYGPDYELGSTLKTFPAKEKSVDGKTLTDIMSDEIGKTHPKQEANVYERNAVQAKAVFRNQVKRGIIRATTTVEEMDKGGNECYEIWKESDPTKRDPNGYTTSKLYKFLVSGVETQTNLADKYGNIPLKEARQQVINERIPLLTDPYKLSIVMRKNPLNEEEAFIKDQADCIFNILTITKRLSELKAMPNPPGRRGRLEWVGDKVDGDVEFFDDPTGNFLIWYLPDRIMNKSRVVLNACDFLIDGNGKKHWLPCNNDLFRSACDPIKYVRTTDPRASKMAAYGFRMYQHDIDGHKKLDDGSADIMAWETYNTMWRYWFRSPDPEEDYENIIKAVRFFGHSIMPENNAGELVKHMIGRGYGRFIIVKRNFDVSVLISKGTKNALGKDQPVHSTTEVIESYVSRIKKFINRHGMRILDPDFLMQAKEFDPNDPTFFDLVVGFGYLMLAIHADIEDFASQKLVENIETYFQSYDISGSRSHALNLNNNSDSDSDGDDGTGEPYDFENAEQMSEWLNGKR